MIPARAEVKIFPGQFYVTKSESILTTTLGSCVAACIRCTKTRISGMNHFLLPGDVLEGDAFSARYGVYAMDVLVGGLLKAGAQRDALEVKLFGGAAVIDGLKVLEVGERNSDFALRYVDTERFRLVAADLRGKLPRRIRFDPITGEVKVKYLRELKNDTIVRREEELLGSLRTTRHTGAVELYL